MRGKKLKPLCPECGTPVRPGRKELSLRGVVLGVFAVSECPKCGEYSFTSRGYGAAEKAAKAKGLFGIEAEVPAQAVHAGRPARAHA